MQPQRAYVLFPRVTTNTLRGIRKYSTVRANANEFGGMMHTSPPKSTKLFSSKFFGSTMVELMLVKILNSLSQRTSEPELGVPEDTILRPFTSRTCPGSNGSIIACSRAMRRIQLSD